MLDEAEALDRTLVARYGHLLPDSLIRSTVDAAPVPQVAHADVRALADAVRRAPAPAQQGPLCRHASAAATTKKAVR
jgi:hypothetical protein